MQYMIAKSIFYWGGFNYIAFIHCLNEDKILIGPHILKKKTTLHGVYLLFHMIALHTYILHFTLFESDFNLTLVKSQRQRGKKLYHPFSFGYSDQKSASNIQSFNSVNCII